MPKTQHSARTLSAGYKRLTASTHILASGLELAGSGLAERLGNLPECAAVCKPAAADSISCDSHIQSLKAIACDKAEASLSPPPPHGIIPDLQRKNFAWACSMGDAILNEDNKTINFTFNPLTEEASWSAATCPKESSKWSPAGAQVLNISRTLM